MSGDFSTENYLDSRKYPLKLHALFVTPPKDRVSHERSATIVKVTWSTLPDFPFLNIAPSF
jgi:hypothetical protein